MRRLNAGDGLEFTVDEFLLSFGDKLPNEQFEEWLEQKISNGALDRIEIVLCPVIGCHFPIDEGAEEIGICPRCNTIFEEEDLKPQNQTRYQLIGEPSKDIYWMIVVHGMNTRGAWQEEISWRLANKFKYSAPVLIYKYGWATIDVLVKWRHRQLAIKLGTRIREATRFANEHRTNQPPDVIIHSFGTHLFSLLLENSEYDDLKFGRVITVGSIIHPNFDWKKHIESGKIESVFNHVGKKDIPVRAAQFCIPGTGPSGHKGFTDKASINVPEEEYAHSSAFEPEKLKANLQSGGLWDEFLQSPPGRFHPNAAYQLEEWNGFFAPIRWVTRILCILLFTIVFPFSLLRRVFDP